MPKKSTIADFAKQRAKPVYDRLMKAWKYEEPDGVRYSNMPPEGMGAMNMQDMEPPVVEPDDSVFEAMSAKPTIPEPGRMQMVKGDMPPEEGGDEPAAPADRDEGEEDMLVKNFADKFNAPEELAAEAMFHQPGIAGRDFDEAQKAGVGRDQYAAMIQPTRGEAARRLAEMLKKMKEAEDAD
jgi:hypothetical protein